jgi:hypothetical protein
VATRTYRVAVTGGRLEVRVHDTGGRDPWVLFEALSISPAPASILINDRESVYSETGA